jgi:hypothetical protein
MLNQFLRFFSPTEGSIKGFLNPEELFRAIVTSLGSGTTVGALMAILQAIIGDAGAIFPNSTVATLATGLLTLVLDLLRRQNQGATPAPTPLPAPTPTAH